MTMRKFERMHLDPRGEAVNRLLKRRSPTIRALMAYAALSAYIVFSIINLVSDKGC